MTIEEIANTIKEKSHEKTPILIAIDGFGGSGKSTIAKKLADSLGNAYVIGIDDFIVKELLLKVSGEENPSTERGSKNRF